MTRAAVSALALTLLLAAAPKAFSAELVLNGGFQAGGSEVADNWSLTGFAWVPGAGTVNSWTGGLLTTRALNVGGYTTADDSAWQNIATAGYAAATLSFDFVWEDWDVAGKDFFTVSFGSHLLETFDLGATPGSQLGNLYKAQKSYDLTPYMDGTAQRLTFRATTDSNSSGGSTACSAYVDNVSIQTRAVPEPASVLAFGAGLSVFLKRSRQRRR